MCIGCLRVLGAPCVPAEPPASTVLLPRAGKTTGSDGADCILKYLLCHHTQLLTQLQTVGQISGFLEISWVV